MTRTVLVCADCRYELEQLGAVADDSPRQMTPGRSCDVHTTSRHVQAMHAMHATAEQLARHRADNVETQPADAEPAADWLYVAQLAATLAAATGEPFSEDLAIVSVANARVLLAAAKKGG
jgi:hypothetical protein